MRAVGLKELKNRLSEYVRIAAQGERVLVTGEGDFNEGSVMILGALS